MNPITLHYITNEIKMLQKIIRVCRFNDTLIFKTKVNQTRKQHLINWLDLMNDSAVQEQHDR